MARNERGKSIVAGQDINCSQVAGADEDVGPPLTSRHMVAPQQASPDTSPVTNQSQAYCPFSISPACGVVEASAEQTFSVTFSPMIVQEFHALLSCSMNNLAPGMGGPTVQLKGRCLLPYCHFLDFEESDYLTGSRRNPDLLAPFIIPSFRKTLSEVAADPTTKVTEFHAVGVCRTIVKKFDLMNPTNMDYSALWECMDPEVPGLTPPFTCCTPSIYVRSMKKNEIVFEFQASSLHVVESYWQLRIPFFNFVQKFLIVGRSREPQVMFDQPFHNFDAVLIGNETSTTVNLLNNEDESFQFKFDLSSCCIAECQEVLNINPTLPVCIRFNAQHEKEVNFNVKCYIKCMTSPLSLNIKGRGYAMNAVVSYGKQGDEMMTTLQPAHLTTLDFGKVRVYDSSVLSISIQNVGSFKFEFSFTLSKKNKPVRDFTSETSLVSIVPSSAVVEQGDKCNCTLVFRPKQQLVLQNYLLTLYVRSFVNIKHGATYCMLLAGQSDQSSLDFSCSYFNFGSQFIYKADVEPPCVLLTIKNQSEKPISLNCTSEPDSWLSFHFKPHILNPCKSLSVKFSFHARETKMFDRDITFVIDEVATKDIHFHGQGVELNLGVENPCHNTIDLGALCPGQCTRRLVPIANKSLAPVTFQVNILPEEKELLHLGTLSIGPAGMFTIPACSTFNVDISFAPWKRIKQFNEAIIAEGLGFKKTLFMIKGSGLGFEVLLNVNRIYFGACVQKSVTVKQLHMSNTGDFGTNFRWDTKEMTPNFCISPERGYIPAGAEVLFDVTFQPKKIVDDIRVESWVIRPVIESEHWTGSEIFNLQPNSTSNYILTYQPMVMTSDNEKHTSSIFFPFPDGTGVLYNLVGIADAPSATTKITREIPCRTLYVESIPVENWLNKPQKFRIKIDYLLINAPNTRDNKDKNDKISLREKVIFVNSTTHEYSFVELTLTFKKPDVVCTFEMNTTVRQKVTQDILIINPLMIPTTFTVTSSLPDLCYLNQLIVPAVSEKLFYVEYFPLKPEILRGKLEMTSNEMGQLVYEIKLIASESLPEKELVFKTSLGSSQSQLARFTNYSKSKTDYICKVNHSDFTCEKVVTAINAGTEQSIEVTYQPSSLGRVETTLVASSPHGGTYTFPIFAECQFPRPQGPFVIKHGSPATIVFKNVFKKATKFNFHVDNPNFRVNTASETIQANRDYKIIVTLDGTASATKLTKTGKLIVVCPQATTACQPSRIQWDYYLKVMDVGLELPVGSRLLYIGHQLAPCF
ncbi:hypothetical protein HELRODRAFT_187825 [Helobdella robusta]|uniref:Abnormal spindle-like microcephaly-associated protein ASH domain-containing protein n=1 Tax=Helobdella robusta TaxID=6412 RepID=T1FPE7_HELRO|nr:hypothetical protein HELRODRAFT_187825 [Helobdella robusta]ESO12294.1 hypothetical protein HELRODRAFT_187825 [Helobdella robusta]